jgi:hypothetical protein
VRPVRLSVTFQETASGWAARVVREDVPRPYGFPETHREPMDAISFAAGTVMRELSEAVREHNDHGSAA